MSLEEEIAQKREENYKKQLEAVQYVRENLDFFHSLGIDIEQIKILLNFIENIEEKLKYKTLYIEELEEQIEYLKERIEILKD